MPLKAPPDQDIVIVGATGDLAQRKLIPALYNLHVQKLLPEGCDIIGAAPFDWNDQKFQDLAESAVTQFSRTPMQKAAFKSFAARLHFVPLGADGDLSRLRTAAQRDRRIAYLAVPPSAFTSLIEGIKSAGFATGTSIIIEKPFGHDMKSAEELNRTLHDVVPENRIFRIDHYMGKETVQNLLVFRFGNSLFERIWSRDAIARVEITVAESLGVEQRGKLYEEIGAIRDIVQNHMFQVLALVAMDPPLSFDAEAIRNEKVKVLQSIQPIHPHDVVRGQYTAGAIDGDTVAGYRDEPGVSSSSTTETYAALRLHLEVVALVGRALPPPHRQAIAHSGHARGHHVSRRSAAPVQDRRCPYVAPQPACGTDSAGRGHRPLVRRQAARPGGHRAIGGHELQLRRLVQDIASRGV